MLELSFCDLPSLSLGLLHLKYPSAKFRSIDEEGNLKEIQIESLSRIIKDLEKIGIIQWSKVIHEHFKTKLGNQLLSIGSANSIFSVSRKSQQYRSPLMSPKKLLNKDP